MLFVCVVVTEAVVAPPLLPDVPEAAGATLDTGTASPEVAVQMQLRFSSSGFME
jgi:hypothetical protein